MTFHSLDATTVIILIAAFAAGLVLGAFYFTALWWTVRNLPSSKNQVRLMLCSFFIRMSVVMAGFYLVMGEGHWERLASALLGFVVMRKILTYRLGPQSAVQAVNE